MSEKKHLTISAFLIAVGIAASGYFISETLYKSKIALNTADVKGLAERRVQSDKAYWSIQYSVVGNSKSELAKLYTSSEADQQKIIHLLKESGFSDAEIKPGVLNYRKQEFRDENQKLVEEKHFLVGEYIIKNDKTINEILGNANIELNKDFLRVGISGEIKHLYAKKGYVNIRGFLGAFAFNNTISPRYNWRMDGQTGFYDYTYSEIFPDRGGNNSAFQNQFIENHGGFKVPTALGQSNSWLASSNLKVKLPIGLPIGVFADAGIYPSFNSTDFLYDAGIYFPLINNFFSVYMPLNYFTSIENYLNLNNIYFAERIRFTISINSLNVVKLREKINLF